MNWYAHKLKILNFWYIILHNLIYNFNNVLSLHGYQISIVQCTIHINVMNVKALSIMRNKDDICINWAQHEDSGSGSVDRTPDSQWIYASPNPERRIFLTLHNTSTTKLTEHASRALARVSSVREQRGRAIEIFNFWNT